MKRFDLYELAKQVSGITEVVGNFFAEAAQVCLELNGHQSGVEINLQGLYQEKIALEWDRKLDKETFIRWKDEKEATEYGATAIALLLVLHFGGYKFAERSPQFSIGDFYLKDTLLTNNRTNNEAFLEISGIFKTIKGNTVDIRINQKRKQLSKKPIEDETVLIAVVEFSVPKAKIVRLWMHSHSYIEQQWSFMT
ncbi:MAG: hypothetical protein AAGI23_07145 [Bacteroidota bacterium]